ncbi:hypothetical protein X474_21010 [Dethiosulfatarculus sandiegensis]|uniref:Secreted protein n=1 Tax=Dethiosulfatarculus sandiegensis TaxID=1429043 RepID=A0A0D2GBR8_9BACT|nr:hypothetical protein X474_21010 [Dethiosulfatarculus sandiegensis]
MEISKVKRIRQIRVTRLFFAFSSHALPGAGGCCTAKVGRSLKFSSEIYIPAQSAWKTAAFEAGTEGCSGRGCYLIEVLARGSYPLAND